MGRLAVKGGFFLRMWVSDIVSKLQKAISARFLVSNEQFPLPVPFRALARLPSARLRIMPLLTFAPNGGDELIYHRRKI